MLVSPDGPTIALIVYNEKIINPKNRLTDDRIDWYISENGLFTIVTRKAPRNPQVTTIPET